VSGIREYIQHSAGFPTAGFSASVSGSTAVPSGSDADATGDVSDDATHDTATGIASVCYSACWVFEFFQSVFQFQSVFPADAVTSAASI
jgi:hypothetical protein